MREPYLLAASLLTGLTIPASAIPQMWSIPENNTEFQWNLEKHSQSESKIIANVDISVPEFSNGNSQLSPKKEVKSKVNISSPGSREDLSPPSVPEPSRKIVSGSQLYYQRLASLKTGQIYTRGDDENLQSLGELGKTHKLTYQDWKGLLAMEAKALSQGQGSNRLSILIGDSLSMWFPREKLPPGKLWLNQGISGDSTGGVLKRLATFSKTRPQVIYIMIGINDLLKGNNDEEILRNHRRIVQRLRQVHPKTQIIVQSILPIRRRIVPNSRIRHLNRQIALIAQQEGAKYLNIHYWFTDLEGNLRSELTTDGLHLSPAGYDVWQSALQQIEVRVAQR
ncbi:SGNH/GDSL hydrolase family protein [Cronbergia sp. UHCC 0137]|uniref:SGNH/GDSL hydrolase family protein n=1 Tax=Cronbergia sp. UHCC 0137 TaxID=3110239 RepID=UPI002B2063DC|nr:SGNH/GDSL hydrolase family protein [Cronbergia sp. UHCC 0137]MEA5620165.1 SGNH/GDSL hydrolase family protein [Cronbergia sp. UHCC 0137]